jgi:hypothetical protein
MFVVGFLVLGKDQNVIQIDHDKFVHVLPEDIIHQMLKDSGCIGEAEGHDRVFEMAVACAKSCFPFITEMNPK